MEDIRSNILSVAQDLFIKHGIKSVSVDDICHEVGISKKTFYTYFKGKDEMLEQLIELHHNNAYENALRFMEGKSARDCISMLMNMHSKIGTSNKQPRISYDLQKYYPKLYKMHIHRIHLCTKDILTRHLVQGQQEGLYRRDLDIEMCTIMYSLIQLEIIRQGYELKGVNQKRLIRFIMESFFRSILSDEGMKEVCPMIIDK